MNLALHIKNFGTISDANILLKPLTIFVGPNNSGKSYAAMLIHSVVLACNQTVLSDHRTSSTTQALDEFMPVIDKINRLKLEEKNTVVPDSLINEIAKSWFEMVFNNELPAQIESNFTSKLKDLVRINEATFSIDLFNSNQIHVDCKNGLWLASDISVSKRKIIVNMNDRVSKLISINNNTDGSIICTVAARLPNLLMISMFSEILYHTMGDKIRLGTPPRSHYLPAARSGLLQGHRVITAGIIKSASYAGIKGTRVPLLSGVVADFISSIANMPTHQGKFYELAEDLESDILHGQIRRLEDEYGLYEIKYKFLNRDISLHNTSSTVSEMAPLILYLKHIVEEGSLLIIEEPEAHLHPANQIVLARHIARMIRSGLNILITTHSPFLLEQLSLLLQAGNVDQKTRKDMGLGSDEFLMADEVSPYLFAQIAPGNHTANPIECSSDEGISQEEFVKVQEELYDQTMRVEKGVF